VLGIGDCLGIKSMDKQISLLGGKPRIYPNASSKIFQDCIKFNNRHLILGFIFDMNYKKLMSFVDSYLQLT
jgi:hypothetical protein